VDLLTFISQRDALSEQNWWQSRIKPLILPVFELNRKVLQGESFRLVFVGDGKYVANRKSLDFLEEVLRYLPSSYEIHLFGDSLKCSNPRFKSHGYVTKSELYRSRDIHLVPVKFGSGLKLKAAVPLWNGLPVVATVEGANGLSLSSSLFVGNTPKEFAKEILVAQKSTVSFLLNPPKETVFIDNNLAEITTWLQTI
jgi:glycosyltransferase involved in cell wall biosynthesis